MDLRDLAPPLGSGAFPPPRFLPPLLDDGVRGARSWTGLTYGLVPGYRPLTLDLHRPVHADRPVPLVMWIHGGGWIEGDRRYVPLQWGQQTLFDKVVAAGMAVATVDYRLLAEASFPACVHDCAAALRYLRHHSPELGLDPDHVGVWGESAGAQLAAMIAFLGSRRYVEPPLVGSLGVGAGSLGTSAAVLFYGPDQMDSIAEEKNGLHGLGAFDGDRELVRQMAPIEQVHGDIPPVLLMHGDADSVVGVDHSQRLHQALCAAGVDATLEVTPGADHCFLGTPIEPHLDRAVSFLRQHLLAR